MVMFHSYVSLPEGNPRIPSQQTFHPPRPQTMSCIISFQASELPLKSSNPRTLGYGAPITPVTMAILYYIILYHIILYYIAVYYIILYYIILLYIYYIYYIYDPFQQPPHPPRDGHGPVCTLYVRCMYAVCTLYVRCMYAVCTLYVRCMYAVCTLYIKDIVYTPHLPVGWVEAR